MLRYSGLMVSALISVWKQFGFKPIVLTQCLSPHPGVAANLMLGGNPAIDYCTYHPILAGEGGVEICYKNQDKPRPDRLYLPCMQT